MKLMAEPKLTKKKELQSIKKTQQNHRKNYIYIYIYRERERDL